MCGILFTCGYAVHDSEQSAQLEAFFQDLQAANAARGPDAQDSLRVKHGHVELAFYGSELRLRGNKHISQPHKDEEGNILCWNGEIFEGLQILPEENDGVKLFSALRDLANVESIRNFLGSIEGPYAIMFYHARSRKLLFARDPLGRRSLLLHRPTPEAPNFCLTSVCTGHTTAFQFEELPTDCFFALDIERLSQEQTFEDFSHSLTTLPRSELGGSGLFASLPKVNQTVPDAPPQISNFDHIPTELSNCVDLLISHLDGSVRLRVSHIPQSIDCKGNARVAVLFSGGIDSTVLALLAHRHIDQQEPIDLLNVAFENPRKLLGKAEAVRKGGRKHTDMQSANPNGDANYEVPDRLTGLQELEELRRLCPSRTWNFVEINVPFEEYQATCPHVEALMFPGRTVMDLSLAIALYFAARGVGQVRTPGATSSEPYTSPARVLLNGLGADELLGGYGRFRTAFKFGSWQAIIDELQLQLDRIPTRNLGRDDRIISSHGKEVRQPFLSLSVVSFLAQLPVHVKLDPRLEAGFGEKMLLRLAAYKLGLVEASTLKKRAMQFGSHSARMTPGGVDRKGDIVLAGRTDVKL